MPEKESKRISSGILPNYRNLTGTMVGYENQVEAMKNHVEASFFHKSQSEANFFPIHSRFCPPADFSSPIDFPLRLTFSSPRLTFSRSIPVFAPLGIFLALVTAEERCMLVSRWGLAFLLPFSNPYSVPAWGGLCLLCTAARCVSPSTLLHF